MFSSNAERPLSLSCQTLSSSSFIEVIEAAAGSDIRSVGLRLIPAANSVRPDLISNGATRREVEAALRHHGVTLLEMGAVVLNGPRPSTWCKPALEVGARLGARFAVAYITETDPDKRLDDFSDLCRAAAEQGLKVAVEFVPYSSIKTVEDAADLVAQSGWENASVVVDALHLHRSGGSVASLRDICADLISIAQICDAPLAHSDTLDGLQNEARRERLDPGEGSLPLDDFVKALPPHAALELEVPNFRKDAMPPTERVRVLAERMRRLLSA